MPWRTRISCFMLLLLLMAACNRPAALSPRLTPPDAATQPVRLVPAPTTITPTASLSNPAASPSQAVERTSTPAPTGTLTTQKIPTGRATTWLSPTATASLPPVSVKCYLTSTGTQKCEDNLLNISFEYPSEWGRLAYFLNYARLGGLEYYYGFSQAPESLLWAGGMSRDYSLPPGKIPLGWFNGFHGLSSSAYCREIGASLCQEINPGVLQVIQLPKAAEICSPGMEAIRQPQFELFVDLPANRFISGFTLQSDFLSPAALQTLWAPLHLQADTSTARCGDARGRQAFDVQVSDLERQLQSGALVDEDSQTALEILRRIASSVMRR